ncbi:MAG: YigZ family protein, partial [Cohaesibacter sp.]|nr:YigZ family protein [Cohaesibacter sp.]
MVLYTLEQEAFAELEEKKSRFLTFLVPIDHFQKRLDALRIDHRKANHHVTAFRLIHDDDQIEEGAKDDGEPAGTSGMPMLK